MKNLIAIVIIGIIVLLSNASVALAKQVYNCVEGKWETIPDNSKWNLRYNSHSGKWSYQPNGAKIVVNHHNDSWDWDSGHANEEDEEDEEDD